jgi:hypothetical protein
MSDATPDIKPIDAALAGISPDQARQHFGLDVMRKSLERQRDQLNGWLRLALTRDGRLGTGAELSLVAGVLSSLQDSVSSIAQVVAGQPTARGLIPAAIKEATELRVAAAEPGSLNLLLVPVATAQEPLFQDSDETLLEVSVDRLIGLLSRADGDRGELLGDIGYLGPRVTSHVQLLTNWLSEGRATAALQWRSRNLDRTMRLDTPAATQLRDILREVEEGDSRTLILTGRLVGGSLVRGTFELELDPEINVPEATLITGRADEGALSDLEQLFGQRVTANVEARESKLRSGETRETHILKSLGGLA